MNRQQRELTSSFTNINTDYFAKKFFIKGIIVDVNNEIIGVVENEVFLDRLLKLDGEADIL